MRLLFRQNGVETPLNFDGQTIQVNEMPVASADYVGVVYQYIGSTTTNYIHNYFYECIEDTSTSPATYSWVQINIQPSEDNIVQSDWNQSDTTADDYIKNKPNLFNVIEKVSTLPEPSREYVGKIYLYTGFSTNDLKYAHLYECRFLTTTPTTYFWYDFTDSNWIQPDWNQTNSFNADYIKNKPDLTTKQDVIQYSTMPTASADLNGTIVQYIGATDSTYTNGYFYECKFNGSSGRYFWTSVDTMYIQGRIDAAVLNKENKIKKSPIFTLAAASWNTNTKKITLGISNSAIKEDSGVYNIIQITPSEEETWLNCGIKYDSSTTGDFGFSVDGEQTDSYTVLSSIIFSCDTIPSSDLTFKFISVEVD